MRYGKRQEFTVLAISPLSASSVEVQVKGYELLDISENLPRLIVFARPQFYQYGELKGQSTGEQDTKHWEVAEFYTSGRINLGTQHKGVYYVDRTTRKGAAAAAIRVLSEFEPDQLESLRNIKANGGKLIHKGKVLSDKTILNDD